MTTTIIFLSIFLVIILLLIGVAIYGSKKDKREKTLALKKVQNIEKRAYEAHIKTYLLLDSLIIFVKEQLENFKKDPNEISISKVNTIASNAMKHIQESKELRIIYESEDRKIEFKPVIDQLTLTKPSNWNKEAFFAVSLVKAKAENYKKSKENNDLIFKINQHKWN